MCPFLAYFNNSDLVPGIKYSSEVQLSISSGQRNLMKTYHNDANTSRITKICIKNFFWTFFDKEDRLAKLQKFDFQSHFSKSKIVQKNSLKNINLQGISFGSVTSK